MPASKTMIAAAAICLAFTAAASAKSRGLTVRAQQEQACYNDAMKLCPDAVPDEAKITACMGAKRSQLSPLCGKVFDAGQ